MQMRKELIIMPSNMRPGRYIDPIRKNQSIAEIEDAQNTWDLLNEQEKANKLAQENINIQQQKIEEERENAERIANATKQAEKERQMHEKDIEIMYPSHHEAPCNIELIDKYIDLCEKIITGELTGEYRDTGTCCGSYVNNDDVSLIYKKEHEQ